MTAGLYVKEAEKTPTSAQASEAIYEGDFVTLESGNGVHQTDPDSDAVVDGIVLRQLRGQHLPEHDRDFSEQRFETDDPVSGIQLLEDKMKLDAYTVRDDSAPAPSITRTDVVGIIYMDGSNYGSGHPVLVEEGYSADPSGGGSETFDRSNSNFLPVGLAEESVSDTSEQVQVRVYSGLLATR